MITENLDDHCNVNLTRELIEKDILVIVTGCVTTAAGKAGLLVADASTKQNLGCGKFVGL